MTNQGTANSTNIRVVCTLEDTMDAVSAVGATRGSVAGKVISFEPLPSLAPRTKATWKVVVKAVGAGDARFKVAMTSDQIQRPVDETEATHFYQ